MMLHHLAGTKTVYSKFLLEFPICLNMAMKAFKIALAQMIKHQLRLQLEVSMTAQCNCMITLLNDNIRSMKNKILNKGSYTLAKLHVKSVVKMKTSVIKVGTHKTNRHCSILICIECSLGENTSRLLNQRRYNQVQKLFVLVS